MKSLPNSAGRLAAITLAAGLALVACGTDGDSSADSTAPAAVLSGYEVDPPLAVAGVSLPEASAEGAEFEFVAEQGQLLIAYFGYTSCPDVCPTTLYEVKKALAQLGDDASKVDLAMATVDPDHDTAEIITGYLQSFVPTAHALRSEDIPALEDAAAAFGASFSVVTNAEGEVEVTHSPNLYLVDDTGTVVLTWLFGVPADAMATDLAIMLDRIYS